MSRQSPNPRLTEQDFEQDFEAIFEAMNQLAQLETELNGLFPERDFLMRQMVLAVLTKMNVLIYGTFGTGKSALIKQFMRGLEAEKNELFSIELTRFTTESDVFGAVDVPLMREEGVQRRNPAGTIREARFADIGEIFDAAQLLRSLLGVLNERYYSRGVDSGPVPLHTAIASTNIDPQDLLKRHPESGAVVDRFLFQCRVHWLHEDESLHRMFQNFLGGLTPETVVDHDSLMLAANLVASPTDQINPDLLPAYVQVVTAVREKWSAKGWRKFSDRAVCLWLYVLEANAILNKRYNVTPADFHALKYVVCDGGDAEQLVAFDEVAGPIITKAADEYTAMSIDEAIKLAIEAIRSDWPDAADSTTDPIDLVIMRRLFEGHRQKVETMKPELPATQAHVLKLRSDVDERIRLIDTLIRG